MKGELLVEAVELGGIDMLEEEIVPCTGCGCECHEQPPAPGGGGGGEPGSVGEPTAFY